MSRRRVISFVDDNWDWLSFIAAGGAALSYIWVLLAFTQATPHSIWWHVLLVIGLVLANLVIALVLISLAGFLAFSRRLLLWAFYYLPQRSRRN